MCGMLPEVWDVMSHSGLIETVGKENLFVFDERHPHIHMQKAVARAKYLVIVSQTHVDQEQPIKGSVPNFSS